MSTFEQQFPRDGIAKRVYYRALREGYREVNRMGCIEDCGGEGCEMSLRKLLRGAWLTRKENLSHGDGGEGDAGATPREVTQSA